MTTTPRSPIPGFVLAGALFVLTGATGVGWLGEPLRLVHLVAIIGLGMATGVCWVQAVTFARDVRGDEPDVPAA